MKPEANLHRAVSTQLLELDEPTPTSRSVSPLASCASPLCADRKLLKGLEGVIPPVIPESNGPLDLLGRLALAETQSCVSQLPLNTRLDLCEIRHRAQKANHINAKVTCPD